MFGGDQRTTLGVAIVGAQKYLQRLLRPVRVKPKSSSWMRTIKPCKVKRTHIQYKGLCEYVMWQLNQHGEEKVGVLEVCAVKGNLGWISCVVTLDSTNWNLSLESHRREGWGRDHSCMESRVSWSPQQDSESAKSVFLLCQVAIPALGCAFSVAVCLSVSSSHSLSPSLFFHYYWFGGRFYRQVNFWNINWVKDKYLKKRITYGWNSRY